MENRQIQQLVQQSKTGDKEAFSELVRYFQPKIFALAFRMLCYEEEAKDALQDTFVKAWLQLKTYRADYQFFTWLYKIASNVCLDKLKSYEKTHSIKISYFEQYMSANQSDIETETINKETIEKIRLLLVRTLSPKQKMLFTLRYLEGLEVKEIEEISGLSAEKIKSNLYLARQTVTNKLKND